MRISLFLHLFALINVLNCFNLNAEEISILDNNGNEIIVQESSGSSSLLVIWLDDHVEDRPMYENMLTAINQENITLWRANLVESYFIPRSSENIRNLSGDGVEALIQAALKQTSKQIIIASYERTPVPILRGIRQWQLNNHSESRFLGSILFYPNLFGPPPLAGEDPILDPIVSATNYPLVIYQPDSGSQRLRLNMVLQALWQAGSPAIGYLVPGVRDWFFMGETDHGKGDINATAAIPNQFFQFAKILQSLPKPEKALIKKTERIQGSAVQSLVKYDNKRKTPDFKLLDFKSKQLIQSEFLGKVTLLNFWATWCPPCVEEVPSLNRLQKRYLNKPFELISIDYREQEEQLQQFMEKIEVDFPILMDITGQTSLNWKVFSFPSSFIIDKKGNIRYSANRAIDWDTEDVWIVIDELLNETL